MWLLIAKMVVMFSLATGAVMDVLIATFKTSEVVLPVNSTITYCLEMCWQTEHLGVTWI